MTRLLSACLPWATGHKSRREPALTDGVQQSSPWETAAALRTPLATSAAAGAAAPRAGTDAVCRGAAAALVQARASSLPSPAQGAAALDGGAVLSSLSAGGSLAFVHLATQSSAAAAAAATAADAPTRSRGSATAYRKLAAIAGVASAAARSTSGSRAGGLYPRGARPYQYPFAGAARDAMAPTASRSFSPTEIDAAAVATWLQPLVCDDECFMSSVPPSLLASVVREFGSAATNGSRGGGSGGSASRGRPSAPRQVRLLFEPARSGEQHAAGSGVGFGDGDLSAELLALELLAGTDTGGGGADGLLAACPAPGNWNIHAAALNTEPAGLHGGAWVDIDLQGSAVLQSEVCFGHLTDSALNCLLLANRTCPCTPRQHCREWKRFRTHNHRHQPMPVHPAHNTARMQAVVRMFERQGNELLVNDRDKKHAACQGPRYDVTMDRMAKLMQRLDPTDSSSQCTRAPPHLPTPRVLM